MKAHRLVDHSTLGSKVSKRKRKIFSTSGGGYQVDVVELQLLEHLRDPCRGVVGPEGARLDLGRHEDIIAAHPALHRLFDGRADRAVVEIKLCGVDVATPLQQVPEDGVVDLVQGVGCQDQEKQCVGRRV